MRVFLRFRGGIWSPLVQNPVPKWRMITVKRLGYVSPTSRFFSSPSTPPRQSFTVSYLVNSCGLSPQSALSASKKLHLGTPHRADAVISLLRDYGITDAGLRKLITVFPVVLSNDPEKTLLPKLRFLDSKPFSRADIGRILSCSPMILSRSLENQLIPLYNFLKSIVHSDERVVHAIKRSPRIFLEDVSKKVVPNIAALREIGVPESSIVFFVTYFSSVVPFKPDKFAELVKEVTEMGLDPETQVFVQALQVFAGMTKSTREQKMEVYRRWGWRDDEIASLIRAFPVCMSLSEKKITGTMDFLVNKMGWGRNAISRSPITLGFSLEKRIIPRCLVGKVLMLKGLKKDLSIDALLRPAEHKFLERFVIKYQNNIPQLLNLYEGEVGVVELGFPSEETSGSWIQNKQS